MHIVAGYDLDGFKAWLDAVGAVHRPLTSQWEVMRFVMPSKDVHVVYRNKRDRITMNAKTQGVYRAFQEEVGVVGEDAVAKVKRAMGRAKTGLFKSLYDRDVPDGRRPECCYCGQFSDDPTIEHFVPVSNGGKNHASNCGLACEPCNQRAGNLPVVEKIALRDAIREAVSQIPPWEVFDARQI